MSSPLRNIYVTISRDARVRDVLRIGTLDCLLHDPDVRVIILTTATRDPAFVEEFTRDRVVIRPLRTFSHTRRSRAMLGLRQRLRWRWLRALWYWFECRFVPDDWYDGVFDEFPPDAVLLPDLIEIAEWPVVANARRRGVRTIGTIRSWDNVHKGLPARVDVFCAPNEQNAEEARKLEKYGPDQIVVTGTPQFDLYFESEAIEPREKYLRGLGLDPDRKTIVFAPAGAKFLFMAAEWLDVLLTAQQEGDFGVPTQVISRNHPADPLGPFLDEKYDAVPHLHRDFPRRWFRSLGWQMTRTDVRRVANMLAHADVVVTPASTFTIEAAIFDTPTVVVAFSEIVPDVVRGTLQGRTFQKHFKGLLDGNLVPVAETRDDLIARVRSALQDPAADADKRRQIVDRWVGPRDARSSERLARVTRGLPSPDGASAR